jgi:hypothetical protein
VGPESSSWDWENKEALRLDNLFHWYLTTIIAYQNDSVLVFPPRVARMATTAKDDALDEFNLTTASTHTNMELDTTDVDMLDGNTATTDKEDLVDFSDPLDPGPEELLAPLDLNAVPETLDFDSMEEMDGSTITTVMEPGELSTEQIEEIACNADALRGGEELSQEQRELRELRQEVQSLRVDRDVAEKMERRMGAEVKQLREDQQDMMVALARAHSEREWERGCAESLERALDDMRSQVRTLEGDLDYYEGDKSRKRPRRGEDGYRSEREQFGNKTETPPSSLSASTRAPTPAMPTSPRATKQVAGNTRETGPEVNELITTTGQDVFMAPAETIKTKAPSYDQYANERREALIEEVKHRIPATNGKRTTFTTKEPPVQLNYHKDKRGFPTDADRWNLLFQMQQTQPYYVFGFRCFYMWVYARAMNPDERNPAQQLAVTSYVMPDWMANILSVVGLNNDENRDMKKKLPTMRRDAIGYNPALLAQLIQYRELPVRGCGFIDDAFSLNARQVRGYNLQIVLNIKFRKPKAHRRGARHTGAD